MNDSRGSYLEEAEKALKKWDIRLIKLQEEQTGAKPDDQKTLQSIIDQINEKRTVVDSMLRKFKIERTDEGRQQIRVSIEEAMANLEHTYKEALTFPRADQSDGR